MTDITPMIPSDAQVIQGYGPGFVRVSNVVHHGPVLISRATTRAWGLPPGTAELTPRLLIALPDLGGPGLEVLLIGTGTAQLFIPPALRRQILRPGLTIESMTTAAACRTYNVLLSEGRLVMAALLPS